MDRERLSVGLPGCFSFLACLPRSDAACYHARRNSGGQSVLAKVNSCALMGLDGVLVEVEVYVARGLPAITLVGLPSQAVKESKDRVWAAIRNSGLRFPGER